MQGVHMEIDILGPMAKLRVVTIFLGILVTWLVAGWLPRRSSVLIVKLLLAVVLSVLVLIISTLIGMAIIANALHLTFPILGIPYGILYTIYSFPYSLPPLLISLPLLIFGGKAVHLRLTRSKVILGWAGIVLGSLLWMVSAIIALGIANYMMQD
jgi:hypothetical protein